jgi:hypothetical protein
VPSGAQVLAEAAAAAVASEDLMTAWTAGKTLLSMTIWCLSDPSERRGSTAVAPGVAFDVSSQIPDLVSFAM